MSNVDERIVSMKFDDTGFEAGATKAIDILDKLKNSLKFDGAEANVESLKKSISGFDTNGLVESVDSVRSGFSLLENVGIGALRRIGEEAVILGMKLMNSITRTITQGPKEGFEEYQQQIKSIQTISANSGEELEVIKAHLDELNEYADKTIYSFSEMTANIGRFTAAGLDVTTSTNAIKGFSNMAALAGAGTQETARGMYQLSQAMAAGVVKLQDWKSIQNASIDTAAFKDILIETARAMDLPVDDAIKKQGSFNASLSEGWLTADVMSQALQVATMSTRDFADEEDGMAQRMKEMAELGYSESVAKKLIDIANAADDSAREVRTFKQLMETVQEAIGSGWARTWELIVGDFDQATELFTTVSKRLDAMIQASADARNNLLKDWGDRGGRNALIGSVANIVEAIVRIVDPIRDAFGEVFSITGKQLARLTENFARFTQKLVITEDTMGDIYDVFHSVFVIIHSFFGILGNGIRFVSGYLNLIIRGFLGLDSAVLSINRLLEPFSHLMNQIHVETDKVVNSFSDLVYEGSSELAKRLLQFGEDLHSIIWNLANALSSIIKLGASLARTAWTILTPIRELIKIVGSSLLFRVFPVMARMLEEITYRISVFVSSVTDIASRMLKPIRRIFTEVYATISNFFTALFSILSESDLFKTVSGWFDGVISFFSGFISGLTPQGKVFGHTIAWYFIHPFRVLKDTIVEFNKDHSVESFKNWFRNLGDSIVSLKNKALDKIPAPIKKVAAAIKSFFVQVKNFVVNTKIFKQIKAAISDFVGKDTVDFISILGKLKDAVVSNFGRIKSYLMDFSLAKALGDVKNKFTEFFAQFGITIPDFGSSIVDKLTEIKDMLSGLFSGGANGKLFGGLFENLPDTFRSLFDQLAGSFEYGKTTIANEANQLSLDNIAPNVINMADAIAGIPAIIEDIVGRIVGAIMDFLAAFQLPTVEELLSGGVVVSFIGFARSLKKVNVSLAGVIDGFVKWPDKLGTALKQIGEGFNSWRKETKADAILKIAAGIAIIAGALFILASIPSDDLIKAGKAMGIIAGAVVGILTVFALLEKIPNAAGLTTSMLNLGNAIQGFGIGVAAFAVACLIIASIPVDTLNTSIDTVTTIAITLAVMAAAIGQNGKSVAKGAKSFIIMAVGIWAMAKAIEAIGKLDINAIEAAMPIFVGIMLALSVFGAVGAKGLSEIMKSMPKFAIGIAIFAGAIVILSAALEMADTYLEGVFHKIETFGILAGFIAGFVVMCRLLKDANPIESAAGLLIFSAAIAIMAASVAVLGAITDMDSVIDALQAIALLIVEFAAITYNLDAKDLLATGAALLVFAASVGVIALAMSGIANIKDLGKSLKGLTAIGVLIAELAIITKLVGGFSLLMAGTAMLIFAAAVGVLAIALQQFKKVNAKSIGTALVTVAASFGVLGLAALILAPLAPVLLTVSGAFLVFSAAVFVISASLALLTDSLLKLEGYDAATITEKLGGLGQGLGQMLLNMFVDAFNSVYNWLVENRKVLAEHFIGALNVIGEKLGEFGTWLMENAPTVFAGFINWVSTNGPAIMQTIGNAFNSFVEALGPIAENIGQIALAAKDKFIAYITSDEFRAKAEEIKDKFLEALGKLKDKVIEIGRNVITGLINGISEKIGDLTAKAEEMVTNWIQSVKDFFGIASPSTVMSDIGNNVVQGLIDGIGNLLGSLGEKAGEIGSTVLNGLGDFGSWLGSKAEEGMNWFIGGIQSLTGQAGAAGADAGASAAGGMDSFANSAGDKGSEGAGKFVKGIAGKVSEVTKSSKDLMDATTNGIKPLGNKMKDSGSDAAKKFVSGINSGKGSAKSAANALTSAAKNGLGNLSNKFYSVGRDGAMGFINGIDSKISAAASKAAQLAAAAIKAAKKKLDSHSPSKVFRQIGSDTGAGFIIGMNNSIPAIAKASSNMAAVVPDEFSSVLSAMSVDIEDILDTDYSPEITPVINATRFNSDISSITSALNSRFNGINVGNLNYTGELSAKLDGYADINRQAVEAIANNALDYDLLGTAVANALITSGVHVEMDGGKIVGFVAGEVRNARRSYGIV